MLDNWMKMLDETEALRLAQQAEFEAKVANAQKYAVKLRGIVMDAYIMNHDIGAFAYLFDKALIDDAEEDTDLLKASHLVVDVMKTIAARLGTLEERVGLAYEEAGL